MRDESMDRAEVRGQLAQRIAEIEECRAPRSMRTGTRRTVSECVEKNGSVPGAPQRLDESLHLRAIPAPAMHEEDRWSFAPRPGDQAAPADRELDPLAGRQKCFRRFGKRRTRRREPDSLRDTRCERGRKSAQPAKEEADGGESRCELACQDQSSGVHDLPISTHYLEKSSVRLKLPSSATIAFVTGRSYEHYCALAKALDLVGERWTLLIVRELVEGACRYTDLQEGVPGIATDMLAARLRSLEESGLVERRVMPPPAASTVYELTPLGRGLEPVIRELARWGLRLMGKRKGEEFRIHWMGIWMRTSFRPDRAAEGPPLTVQFDVGGESMHARIAGESLETAIGPATEPDVTIAGDAATLSRAAHDRDFAAEAVTKGRLKVRGKREDVKRALQALGLR
jgi:DNA-binding HxlR family transcriptional regulator